MDRKTYVGSTDVSAIIGISKYKNALQVFQQKLGLEQNKQNNAMKMGLLLEPIVLQLAEEHFKVKIKKTQIHYKHPRYDFLGGTADAITECGALIEAKTSRHGQGFTEDAIPDEYLIQIQWLMGLAAVEKCYVYALIGGQEFKSYTFYFNKPLYERLVLNCVHFWRNNIEQMKPPIVEKKVDTSLPDDVYILYTTIRNLQTQIETQNKRLEALKEQFSIVTEGTTEVKHDGSLLAKKTVCTRETLDKKKLAEQIDLTPFIKTTEYTMTRYF